MSLQVFEPGEFLRADPLGPEEASLTRGKLTVPVVLLDRVGIAREAVVLGDPDNCRIAVRRPRRGEKVRRARVSYRRRRGGKKARTAGIMVTCALRGIGLDPKEPCGRFEVMVKDGELLIIGPLADPTDPGRSGRKDHELIEAEIDPDPDNF